MSARFGVRKPKYIKSAIVLARELGYESGYPGIIKKLENAKSEVEVQRILIDGRHLMTDN